MVIFVGNELLHFQHRDIGLNVTKMGLNSRLNFNKILLLYYINFPTKDQFFNEDEKENSSKIIN